MNFNIGDRVYDSENPDWGVGTVVDTDSAWGISIKFDEDAGADQWLNYSIVYDEADQLQLVSEALYNSPLYKALR